MEQEKTREIEELDSLITAIGRECGLLHQVIMTGAEEEDVLRIYDAFDMTAQIQVFSTLNHLVMYQLSLWRDLVDGGGGNGGNERTEV